MCGNPLPIYPAMPFEASVVRLYAAAFHALGITFAP